MLCFGLERHQTQNQEEVVNRGVVQLVGTDCVSLGMGCMQASMCNENMGSTGGVLWEIWVVAGEQNWHQF